MIFADLVQPIDVPATLIAIGGVITAMGMAVGGCITIWLNVKAQLEEIGKAAQASVDRSEETNAVLEKVHGVTARKVDDSGQKMVVSQTEAIPSPVTVVNPDPVKVQEVPTAGIDPEAVNQELRHQIAELTDRLRLAGNGPSGGTNADALRGGFRHDLSPPPETGP
jgi:hypothetical protein